LAERFRDAGVRGIEIAPTCSSEVMLQFAAFLREARRVESGGSSRAWPDDRVGLRVHPLVFEGSHRDQAPDAVDAPVMASKVGQGLPAPIAHALATISETPEYRAQIAKIEAAAAAAGHTAYGEVDPLTTIGGLLPAEIANDPEIVPAIVARILESFEAELNAMVAGNRKLVGGHLLQRAIEVARRYFPSSAPTRPVASVLPSGRPEDARIEADLSLLLDEHETLPPDDRNLVDLIAKSIGTGLGHEVLGVRLHLLAKDRERPRAAEHLTQLLRLHATERPDLLDSYLLARATEGMPQPRRLQLIHLLLDAGHGQLVRDRGYVDHDLVTRNFPDSLSLVVRVFAEDPRGCQLLRECLATLARTLSVNGVDAAVRSGVLKQPAVLQALLAAASEEAHSLLVAAANHHPREARPALLEYLRRQQLPESEALVLRIHGNVESLPSTYVRMLFVACIKKRFDDAMQKATGELLLQALHSASNLGHRDRLAIVDQLPTCPVQGVEPVLARLANEGRFLLWGAARALRRHARRALERLRNRTPR
jgi:hypothetical protein